MGRILKGSEGQIGIGLSRDPVMWTMGTCIKAEQGRMLHSPRSHSCRLPSAVCPHLALDSWGKLVCIHPWLAAPCRCRGTQRLIWTCSEEATSCNKSSSPCWFGTERGCKQREWQGVAKQMHGFQWHLNFIVCFLSHLHWRCLKDRHLCWFRGWPAWPLSRSGDVSLPHFIFWVHPCDTCQANHLIL